MNPPCGNFVCVFAGKTGLLREISFAVSVSRQIVAEHFLHKFYISEKFISPRIVIWLNFLS